MSAVIENCALFGSVMHSEEAKSSGDQTMKKPLRSTTN
jgi:hypothetical protein